MEAAGLAARPVASPVAFSQEGMINAKEAVKTSLTSTQGLMGWYLGDLSDADLLVRPVPGANHIAWQLGHLTASEVDLVRSQVPAAAYPELPAGFKEQYTKETAASDATKGYLPKEKYVSLFNQ